MFRFLRAGLVAGCIQSLLIFGITLAMILRLGLSALALEGSRGSVGTAGEPISVDIGWVYVLIALLVTLVRTPSIRSTADSLKLGFRNIKPTNPEDAANTLLVPLVLAAIGFGILAVKDTPSLFLDLGSAIGNTGYGRIAWAAILSVAAAAFGASAHATFVARDQ